MRKGILQLLYLELLRSWRQGLFVVYLLVSFGLASLLGLLDEQFFYSFYVMLLYLETSIVGFFFIGGIFYLESQDGIHETTVLSPGGSLIYIGIKLMLFGFLALLAALILGFFPPLVNSKLQLDWDNALLLAGVTGLNSMFFSALGIAMASRFRSIMAYAINAI